MTNPTPLSPTAQAVMDAAHDVIPDISAGEVRAIAAALRAAADEVCLRWAEQQHPVDVLNNIADELDPQ